MAWKELDAKLSELAAKRGANHDVNNVLVEALVMAEDHRFYGHAGVDVFAICAAIWRYVRKGKVGGASTIEQQLVRVLTNQRQRTLRRKIREIALATLVTQRYTKTEVAEMYLQVAYFGSDMTGIRAACARLGVRSVALTRWEAACIIARLKYPEPATASPERQRAIHRRAIHIMHRLGQQVPTSTLGLEVVANASVLNS